MVLVIAVQFAIDAVARPAISDAIWTSTLCDKSGDDSVKFQTFIESFLGQFDEVCHCFGSIVFKEFNGHRAVVGDDFCLHAGLFWFNVGCAKLSAHETLKATYSGKIAARLFLFQIL